MPSRGVTIDDRGLKRKFKRLGKAAPRAQGRAANDAAKSTRTHARRASTLNLPVKRFNQAMTIRRVAYAGPRQFYTTYHVTPLTWFRGWVERRIFRSHVITARRRRHGLSHGFGRRTSAAGGITVRFYKDQPPLNFPHAFILRVGGSLGARAWQRERDPATRSGLVGRKPIRELFGPSVHAEVAENLEEYAIYGAKVMRKRAEYWIERETTRL